MPIENVVFYGTNSIHLAKSGLSGGQLELKKGPWKDDGCKGKTSTERDRNRNGPGGQKGALWGPFGGPGDFAQGRFRPKAPKWKLQFYEAFGHKSGFWALPGGAEMKLFEAKSAAEISLEKMSFPKPRKTDQGGQGDQKNTHTNHRGDHGCRPGLHGATL